MKSRLLGAMCACFIVLVPSLAQAAPLNLTLNDVPDILAQFIDVTYNAASDAFVASGFALEIDDDGSVPPEEILNGTFDLSATIDATGTLIGGSLTIGGTVPTLGFTSGTLFTGTLTAFGFPNVGSDPFEFLLDVTGGDAASLYGSGPAGVILSGTGFGGDFVSDFSNLSTGPGTGIAVANVGTVPIPAALWLFGSGLLGLIGLARRRDR
ncbi:hypothetical protein ACFL3A_09470 [Pseudomonadota bacterium]